MGFRMVRGMGLLGAILEAGEGLKVREKKEVFGGEKILHFFEKEAFFVGARKTREKPEENPNEVGAKMRAFLVVLTFFKLAVFGLSFRGVKRW